MQRSSGVHIDVPQSMMMHNRLLECLHQRNLLMGMLGIPLGLEHLYLDNELITGLVVSFHLSLPNIAQLHKGLGYCLLMLSS